MQKQNRSGYEWRNQYFATLVPRSMVVTASRTSLSRIMVTEHSDLPDFEEDDVPSMENID